MTGPAHLALAVAATMGLNDATGWLPDRWGWIAVMIGALFPDIDHANSTISKPGTLLAKFLPTPFQTLLDLVGQVISKIVCSIFGHRGFIHWPVLALAALAAGFFLEMEWLSWFGWGYLLHVFGDFLTAQGVPLFAPVNSSKVSGSPMKTDSKSEQVLVCLLSVYIGWWSFRQLPEPVQQVIVDSSKEFVSVSGKNIEQGVKRAAKEWGGG